jgi:succinoglycan biosynthesis transport protein ExoP
VIQSKREELRQNDETRKKLLVEMQESMPAHQKFLDKLDRLKQKNEQFADMERKIWEFDGISKARKEPITQIGPVVEPTIPVRPRRVINMAVAIVLSFGLGIMLVCLLEHVDHSVKVPEQLTAGLTLPLFGVIPRIKRTAPIHRGGHLWTPGAPDSIEADAFRNLRASLLGVSDKRGPMVTLLVTSAKAGEGKSTTALNLAATCARAGERTLLMDVDLRRPSLAGVFQDPDEPGRGLGLVDVLRGDLPWQRTVVRTDIPNLDFLPTGDTAGIPIEILGTLELRQLIIGLSNHYDRVILDGPAILGLADCRMLGRVVDASILVVRSGAQELRPLQHAKAMLEQSHVVIAGVVFNGLYEDLKNWSSYGPETPYGYTGTGNGSARVAAPGGSLDAPVDDDHAALPMADTLRP